MTCGANNSSCKGKECDLNSLREIVPCYQKLLLKSRIKELDYFARGFKPTQHLQHACESINKDRNMNLHQRRIGSKVLADAQKKLNGLNASDFNSFDELHKEIQSKVGNMYRVGPLTTYDIALRLGYATKKKSLLPKLVYLHAGALEGSTHLKLKGCVHKLLNRDELPEELQIIDSMHVENLLCTCKAALKNIEEA